MTLLLLTKAYKKAYKNLFYVIFLFIFPLSAIAIEVKDLYSANIPVKNHTQNEREQAIKHALQLVLLKVGGKESSLPIFQDTIKNHEQFVSQYQYNRINNENMITVIFNEDKINHLFKESNKPIWGRLRPQIIVWLIEENNLERRLLSSTSDSELPSFILNYTHQRGLPALMPVMDLEELATINIADFWGRFPQPILTASKRYAAKTAVVIRVSKRPLTKNITTDEQCPTVCTNTQYTIDWSLINGDDDLEPQLISLTETGSDLQLLLTQALSAITDTIYQKYALLPQYNDDYLIDVANITSLQSYVLVTKFFNQLSSIESVKLVYAHKNTRRFKLSLIGTEQTLLNSLKLSGQLKQHLNGFESTGEIPKFYWLENE